MKNTLLVSAALLVGGCGLPVVPKYYPKNPYRQLESRNITAEEKKLVGTYKLSKDGKTITYVYLESGIYKGYVNHQLAVKGKWKIVNREIHSSEKGGYIFVHRINKNGSLTEIAYIGRDGNREDNSKEEQETWEKIKSKTLTIKSVAGTYELKAGENAAGWIFLDNGVAKYYQNGKTGKEGKWKLVDKEVHATSHTGSVIIFRIDSDDIITAVATIVKGGNRKDTPKDKQFTIIKIK